MNVIPINRCGRKGHRPPNRADLNFAANANARREQDGGTLDRPFPIDQ
jgi:hypothetical protein